MIKLKDMETGDLCIYEGWICKLLPEQYRNNRQGLYSQFQGLCRLSNTVHCKDFLKDHPNINIKDIPELEGEE